MLYQKTINALRLFTEQPNPHNWKNISLALIDESNELLQQCLLGSPGPTKGSPAHCCDCPFWQI